MRKTRERTNLNRFGSFAYSIFPIPADYFSVRFSFSVTIKTVTFNLLNQTAMNVIDRAKNILLTPKTEWQVIRTETTTVGGMLAGYVLPLSLIPAVVALLSGLLWTSVTYGLLMAVIAVLSVIISFYVGTYVTDALAPTFSSEKNIDRSAQLVGYAYTASAVASILGFVPVLNVLAALAGFGYMVYLLYLGIGPLKNTSEDKRIGYVVVIIIIQVAVYFILSAVLGAIVIRSFYYYH